MSVTGCAVPECRSPHYGKGFCRKHWERNHKHGNPLTVGAMQGATIAERLERYSRAEGDCVVWTGRRNKGGYGQIQVEGKARAAHRVAHADAHGPIPEGLVVRHKCDNPPCIRIEHLELGTHADNGRDKAERGRSVIAGIAKASARFTDEDIAMMRALLAAGVSRTEVMRRTGISQTHIARVARGER